MQPETLIAVLYVGTPLEPRSETG